MSRRLLPAAIVAITVLAACTAKDIAPPTVAHETLADSAEQVMLNVRTLLTDKGVQRGELFADSAYIFDENTRFELRKVRATFNTATGTKDGAMSGDRGRYNVRTQILEGYGNVVITTSDGKKLTSPMVRYNQAANEVSSDSAFTMVETGRTLSGIGFRSDPQLTHLVVLKSPSGGGSFTLPSQ